MTAFTINFRLDTQSEKGDETYNDRYYYLNLFIKAYFEEYSYNKSPNNYYVTSTIHCRTINSDFKTSKELATSLKKHLDDNGYSFVDDDFFEIIQYENLLVNNKENLLCVKSISYVTNSSVVEDGSRVNNSLKKFLLT